MDMDSNDWCDENNWYKTWVYPDSTYGITSSVPSCIATCFNLNLYCKEILQKYNFSIANCTTPAPVGFISEVSVGDDIGKQAGIFVPITMILGLLFLILVLWRSCNKTQIDWYRLIAIYIAVTLGVPLSLALGPSGGGFNRVMGFGILIHNLGEMFILNHVWFGDVGHKTKKDGKPRNRFAGILAILYVWVIMALISFLEPLWLLFFILMVQGINT